MVISQTPKGSKSQYFSALRRCRVLIARLLGFRIPLKIEVDDGDLFP